MTSLCEIEDTHVAQEKQKPLDTRAAAKLEALSHEAQLRFIEYYGDGDLDGAQVGGLASTGSGGGVGVGCGSDTVRRSKSVGDESQLEDEEGGGGHFAVLS